jgi:hypothetical protein
MHRGGFTRTIESQTAENIDRLRLGLFLPNPPVTICMEILNEKWQPLLLMLGV